MSTLAHENKATHQCPLRDQWAIVTASTGVHAMQAPPSPHCEIAIDDQLAIQQDGPYTAFCQLANW